MKFHWKPKLGLQSTVWGRNPEVCRRPITITTGVICGRPSMGNFPEWNWASRRSIRRLRINSRMTSSMRPKLIPEEQIPVRRIGRLVLDRNPDNHFCGKRTGRLCPANIVPGIDFFERSGCCKDGCFRISIRRSPGWDRFHQPINAPKCPIQLSARRPDADECRPAGPTTSRIVWLPMGRKVVPGKPGRDHPTAPGREDREEQGDKLRVRPELLPIITVRPACSGNPHGQ